MKTLHLFLLATTLAVTKVNAQDEAQAKNLLMLGEAALQNKDYLKAINYAEQCEKELSKKNVKTVYLKLSAGKEYASVDTNYRQKTFSWIEEFLNLTTTYKVEPEKLKEVKEMQAALPLLFMIKDQEAISELARKWNPAGTIPTDIAFTQLPKEFIKKIKNLNEPIQNEQTLFANNTSVPYITKDYYNDLLSCKVGLSTITTLASNNIVSGFTYVLGCGKKKEDLEALARAEAKKLQDYFGAANVIESTVLDDLNFSVKSNNAKSISVSVYSINNSVILTVTDEDVVRKYVK